MRKMRSVSVSAAREATAAVVRRGKSETKRRGRRALVLAAGCVVGAAAILGSAPVSHADPPDFASDQVANFTAMIIADQVNTAFQGDPTYVGARIISSGLELSFASQPTDQQNSKITSIENSESEILAADPASPSNPPNVPISVRQVPNALADLAGVGGKVAADRAEWSDAGIVITAWGPDIVSDKMMVWLATYSDSAAQQLENTYGPMLIVSKQSMTAEGSSRTADAEPWWGGDRIDNDGTYCTSWFSATNSLGHNISATAGHCGTGTWTQNGHTYGTVSGHHFGGSMDGEGIPDSSNAAVVWSDPNSTDRQVTGVVNSDTFGTFLCTDGTTDREVCSVEIMETNLSVTYDGQTISGLVYCQQVSDRPAFSAGDSGGPVEATSGSSATKAVGMIEARVTDDPADGFYMPARTIDNYFSLTIKTS